jgi:hypothetical protein
MARVVSAELLDGARRVDRAYEPPEAPSKEGAKSDKSLALVVALIQRLPDMIASATKAPVVNIEAQKPPDIKVTSPVYVTPPEIKIPQAPAVQIPDGKAPVVNVEPPDVHLTISRPNKWKFDISRDEYGRMTTIIAEAL